MTAEKGAEQQELLTMNYLISLPVRYNAGVNGVLRYNNIKFNLVEMVGGACTQRLKRLKMRFMCKPIP